MPSVAPSSADTSSAPYKHLILGTAGHIDHGKTLLVRALTGVDTDRLPEEQRRGLTIELGFAELTLGTIRFGVVDVPGHERFVRTMVAGATGVDIALIVVAADDSVMPQTIEHVEILNLLGVRRGVVAITKIDMVDPEMVPLVAEEVRELLAGTTLASAPICPVSSVTGQGLEALRDAIVASTADIEPAPSARPFRMAVDRVFTVQGRGTVVTGSALRGTVAAGDALEVWPGHHTCRVRDLQAHGVLYEVLHCGQRIAMNISGIDRDLINRGCELATPGYLQSARMIDVRLQHLSSSGRPLKSTSVVRLGIGTMEVPIRAVLLADQVLHPGEDTYAQLRSGEPITAVYGQHFIIRDETATRTIGGGIVLRPNARRKRRTNNVERDMLRRLEEGDAADRVEQVLRVAGFDVPTDLQLCARAGVELDDLPAVLASLDQTGRRFAVAGTNAKVVPAALDDLTERLTRWLSAFHTENPELPGRPIDAVLGWLERRTQRGLGRPLLDRLIRTETLKPLGRFICLPAFAPELSQADEKLLAAVVEEIRAGGFQPPTLDGLSVSGQADRKRRERLATLAVAFGELIRIDGKLYLHADTEQRLRDAVARLIEEKGSVTVAEVRESLGSSRKFVVPFLEYLDRAGFTKRTGDRRILA